MSGGEPKAGRKAATIAPAPEPADVGIVAALPMEMAPLLLRLKATRKFSGPKWSIVEGELDGRVVATLVTGMGVDRARRGAEILMAGHRPRWLLSIGFAGALDLALARDDVILGDRHIDGTEAAAPTIENPLTLKHPTSAASSKPGRRVLAGPIVTIDRVLRTAAEKAELHARTGAMAVEMECHALAQLCAERGTRFLAVRVISDDAAGDLPPEILTIVGPTGSFRLGAAVGAVWRRPSSVKDLWTLREHANEAADRLGAVLADLIPLLI
jgi:adenosylhomocysteine nucleosidase